MASSGAKNVIISIMLPKSVPIPDKWMALQSDRFMNENFFHWAS